MKKVFAVIAALALLGLGIVAHANVFSLGTGFTNLETVAVGNAGNTGELSGEGAGGHGYDRICGSVGYTYNIGKYEVTAKQYTDFLNNKAKCDGDPFGLYNTNMSSDAYGRDGCNIQRSGGGTPANPYSYTVANDWANRPVNYMSYWDSCRFANWLNNGQGDGDTETGAYTLNGYNGSDGRTIQRNAGAKWAVTSEDEWYKAAHYKGGGTNAGYWDFPTQSDSVPGRSLSGTNDANYYTDGYIDPIHYRTEVGAFGNSQSAHGTFDQGGNIFEWNEAVVYQGSRGLRGGSFVNGVYDLHAWTRSVGEAPTNESYQFGFRVSEVPEPSSIVALAVGLISLLGIRRRRT